MIFSCRIISVLIAFAAFHVASAGTNGFLVPPFRGSAASEAGYWEIFTVPIGLPGNVADRAGSTTGAILAQNDTNAFLTGSGNIYNLNGASAFTLADSTPFSVGTVVLQTRALGSELDYPSIFLTYTNESGEHSLEPVLRAELNRGTQPGLGITVSFLWQWDLSGLNVSSYVISFRAAAPSLSFDALTLDTSDQFTPLFTEPFTLNDTTPAIERWLYAFNAAPCDRPAASVFGTLGDDSGVDSRHAQHLVGWDTASLIPTNRGSASYLVRRCRLTLTINRGNLFAYDPSQDSWRTYFETNHPAYTTDSDAGRPIELFGAGFRHGFDAATFDQCAPFGTNSTGQRNAYAAGWSTNGNLVDVSNNVGKTNEAFPQFEVMPFAIGQTTNAAPGELVPAGARITFDLNLDDPLVLAYVQSALHTGRLRFMVTSLHTTAGQLGTPSYPDFATHFNEAVVTPTRLELDGVVVSNGDIDSDGLPDDWELFSLASLTHSGDADADADGASNVSEFRAGTDPSSSSSTLKVSSEPGEVPGQVVLSAPHSASHHCRVEYTEDFITWTPLANAPVFDLETGIAQWTDPAANGSKRFYRLRVETTGP